MSIICQYTLFNILFGSFSIATALVVLFYKKNFVFHNGIAILLLSQGVVACTVDLINIGDTNLACKFYFVSRTLITIFLLLFSEYILKINYHITVKLLTLIPTWVLGIFSFFQKNGNGSWFTSASDIYLIGILLIIITHLLRDYFSSKDRLLNRYLILYLITLSVLLSCEFLRMLKNTPYNLYASGFSAMVLTHGIILIISSGGYSRMNQKKSKLIFIVLISSILSCSLKLLHPAIPMEYVFTLFVIAVFILSFNYMLREMSKNPKEIRSAFLISRLLSLQLNDKDIFLRELRQWEEISELHYVEHLNIEGNSSNLNLLFQKTGRVIHKFQIPELMKALAYNPNFISGIEVAQYYFKKMGCNSLFQVADKGDFLAIKYMKGLNPALYSNELSIMSKIIFSVSNAQSNN